MTRSPNRSFTDKNVLYLTSQVNPIKSFPLTILGGGYNAHGAINKQTNKHTAPSLSKTKAKILVSRRNHMFSLAG